ncbi:MAG: hypothetical protein ABR534_07280 [Desulfotignum sp.]
MLIQTYIDVDTKTFHKNDQLVEVLAEYLNDSFDTDQFGKEFTKE